MVERVYHDALARPVAGRAAFVAEACGGDEELRREARMLAALNHPHIAAIHGVEERSDGVRALVLELVGGETLAERIERYGGSGLVLKEALELAIQIADALASSPLFFFRAQISRRAACYLRYHSWSASPGGTFRVMSTMMVSPSHRFTNCCLRRLPNRNSSTNSMQRYSISCAFGSSRR